MDKEEKKIMQTVDQRLAETNKKVDSIIDKIWLQAKQNLKKLEEDFHKNKGEKK